MNVNMNIDIDIDIGIDIGIEIEIDITKGKETWTCRGRLVEGHSIIVPTEHVASTRQVDDHIWTELRNFKKCVLQMHMAQVLFCLPTVFCLLPAGWLAALLTSRCFRSCLLGYFARLLACLLSCFLAE